MSSEMKCRAFCKDSLLSRSVARYDGVPALDGDPRLFDLSLCVVRAGDAPFPIVYLCCKKKKKFQ